MMHERNDGVVVVGGGLAGLAAAAYVARAGQPVTLYEGRARLGGRATTDERNGFRFNQGPHALYRGSHAERVLNELGVTLRGGQPTSKMRVWFDGKGYAAPATTGSLLASGALGVREKATIAGLFTKLPKIDPATLGETTVAEWIAANTNTTRTRQLLEAIVRLATYTNDPDTLSADAAVLQLQLGMQHGVTYLDGGWQTLIDQLRRQAGVMVAPDEVVTELPDARAVIIAAGGPGAAGGLLDTTFDVGPATKAACLDLGATAAPRYEVMIGGDQPLYVSNHSAAAKLAPEDRHHVAAVQYLGPDDEPNREAIRAFALSSGLDESSIVEERFLHAMTTITSIPAAEHGGMAGRPSIDATGRPNVFLAGDWVGPEGHLGDAVLASARAAAMAAVDCLDRATWAG